MRKSLAIKRAWVAWLYLAFQFLCWVVIGLLVLLVVFGIFWAVTWQRNDVRPPLSPEDAKKTFTTSTGLEWPEGACNIRCDESRVGITGDGEFYVVFSAPPEVIKTWLQSKAPWDDRAWLRGPIPPEIGFHCNFGHPGPLGYSTREGEKKEYEGGNPELIAVLKSKEVWYAARDRASAENRWDSGDLLIIDPTTCVVRYCSWDN